MAESFTQFFNNGFSANRPFGLNVKNHERTLQQAKETIIRRANPFADVDKYIESNQNVFSGDVIEEIKKINAHAFTTGMAMQKADNLVNGKKGHGIDFRG